ncbi:hypothetical protein VPH35_096225 [Triticum aestivum]
MYLEDYNCALCSGATEENRAHVFWDCQFVLECWQTLTPGKQRGICAYDEIQLTKFKLPPDIAMEIILMGCWSIWMSRNEKIFRRAAPRIHTWKHYLKEGQQVTQIRAKSVKAGKINVWIE